MSLNNHTSFSLLYICYARIENPPDSESGCPDSESGCPVWGFAIGHPGCESGRRREGRRSPSPLVFPFVLQGPRLSPSTIYLPLRSPFAFCLSLNHSFRSPTLSFYPNLFLRTCFSFSLFFFVPSPPFSPLTYVVLS